MRPPAARLAAALLLAAVPTAASAAPASAAKPAPAAVLHTRSVAGATLLDASVGGTPGTFLFDTGGGVSSVTPATAAHAGCRPWGQLTGFRMTGERLDLPRCDHVTFAFGRLALEAPIATVLDINRLIGPGVMPVLAGSVALDLFAGRAITVRPQAHELVVETAASLAARIRGATAIRVRPVRDAEGVALTIDAAVPTPSGDAWMELDDGNTGPIAIGSHVAAALGLAPARSPDTITDARLALAPGIAATGRARIADLILDGDIGTSFLDHEDLTLDLGADGGPVRAWLAPASPDPTRP